MINVLIVQDLHESSSTGQVPYRKIPIQLSSVLRLSRFLPKVFCRHKIFSRYCHYCEREGDLFFRAHQTTSKVWVWWLILVSTARKFWVVALEFPPIYWYQPAINSAEPSKVLVWDHRFHHKLKQTQVFLIYQGRSSLIPPDSWGCESHERSTSPPSDELLAPVTCGVSDC